MRFQNVELSWPPGSFFEFPPSPNPLALPPPKGTPSIKAPFRIDPEIYNKALSPKIPVIFAVTYFIIASICNALNRRRGNKPFAVSKTRPFKAFVLAHNFSLALYSGITCVALVRALNLSWAGWAGENGLGGAADSLCKIHGPRGYGDAVSYDALSLKWTVKNKLIQLGLDGATPDATDVGRIWNEGLAFWGWFFYLSKYYEIVDTMIILLKGKRATTLQKYHHAGALLCMWAGMRYMSPPIWMFVLVNSGIHTLMYTFYTASTLNIRVPGPIKRLLTTMQIVQFLVGASFASAHLFISYKIPVSSAYSVWSAVAVAASAARGAPSAVSGLLSSEAPTSPLMDVPAWLKRLAYRAGGAEGLAENVFDQRTARPFHEQRQSAGLHGARGSHRGPERYEWVRCLDTNGQAFAIWLNVVYLTPLTILFLRFCWKSYILGKPSRRSKPASGPRRLSTSAEDAARSTSDTFEEYGTEFEKSMGFSREELAKEVRLNKDLQHAVEPTVAAHENDYIVFSAQEIKEDLERKERLVEQKVTATRQANGSGVQSEQLWFGKKSSSTRK